MLEDLTNQLVHDTARREVISQWHESDHLHESVYEDHLATVAPDSEWKIRDEVYTHNLPFLF